MIVKDFVVGSDKKGIELRCGDVCSFLLPSVVSGASHHMKGIIMYDPDTYSYVFETLDPYAPVIMMSAALPHSIEYIDTYTEDNTEMWQWKMIYDRNVALT